MTCHHYAEEVARWGSDARERLEAAAVELFTEHGFDAVTVPHITARAGLTTRTFFRHFADKREVLFVDPDQMPELVHRIVSEAPADLPPAAVIRRGIPTIAGAFDGRYEQILQRKAIIDGNDGLRERELHKMGRVVDAMTAAFRDQGVDDATASLISETTVAVVKASLRQWFIGGGRLSLEKLMTASFDRLSEVFAR